MGCVKSRKLGYTDSTYEEESELQIFEQQELKIFQRALSSIAHKCMVESQLVSLRSVDVMIKKEFGDSFLKFVNLGYFTVEVNGKKFYDANKIKLLLFLLSDDNVQSKGWTKYHEKAGFIFNYVNIHGHEELCQPIQMENEHFLHFIKQIVDISCNGIVNAYLQVKSIEREKLHMLNRVKESVAKELIRVMFQEKMLVLEELNKMFTENKVFLSPGYIREIAWQLAIKEEEKPKMPMNP